MPVPLPPHTAPISPLLPVMASSNQSKEALIWSKLTPCYQCRMVAPSAAPIRIQTSSTMITTNHCPILMRTTILMMRVGVIVIMWCGCDADPTITGPKAPTFSHSWPQPPLFLRYKFLLSSLVPSYLLASSSPSLVNSSLQFFARFFFVIFLPLQVAFGSHSRPYAIVLHH